MVDIINIIIPEVTVKMGESEQVIVPYRHSIYNLQKYRYKLIY